MIKQIVRLDSEGLYALCNIENWYTLGDNESYNKLLHYMKKHQDEIQKAHVLDKVAKDIIKHSEFDYTHIGNVEEYVKNKLLQYSVRIVLI